MRRKTFIVLFALFICIGFARPALAAPTIKLDGQQLSFDIEPIIQDGRTLVPLEAIFEAMGADVAWDASTLTATGTKGNITVKLTIGSTEPTVNGISHTLDVPGKMADGNPLAPLRFVCEAFGGIVEWEDATQTIHIISSGNVIPKSPIVKPSGAAPTLSGYVGDSNSYKYHRPGCQYVSQITPADVVVSFNNQKEAEAAGYEPCSWCN